MRGLRRTPVDTLTDGVFKTEGDAKWDVGTGIVSPTRTRWISARGQWCRQKWPTAERSIWMPCCFRTSAIFWWLTPFAKNVRMASRKGMRRVRAAIGGWNRWASASKRLGRSLIG